MTFSDKRVVDLVQREFEAVWESVAPVKVAVFDLGDGKTVRGTVGGEIAIYFCRPDGRVFDVLPALQSPYATYHAIDKALTFYRLTGATDEAIREFHAWKFKEMTLAGQGNQSEDALLGRRELDRRMQDRDAGTRALSEMAGSKAGIGGGSGSSESVVVVEPGGMDYYKRLIHQALMAGEVRTPQEWKETVFVRILGQKLVGGEFHYNSESLEPISLTDD